MRSIRLFLICLVAGIAFGLMIGSVLLARFGIQMPSANSPHRYQLTPEIIKLERRWIEQRRLVTACAIIGGAVAGLAGYEIIVQRRRKSLSASESFQQRTR
jgi:hypothetical protein